MVNPLVSVIIPNYNHAPYLKQRIDSVLNQTFQDFEVIIMDDCSTDSSKAIIEEYRNHPKVSHVILNETNSGSPFKQWQKGFALAKGDFIWIAESDDYCEENLLEHFMQAFTVHKEVGLVYCDSNIVDNKGTIHADAYKILKNENFHTEKWSASYIKNGILELRENLFLDCTINNMSATVFKKDLLAHVDWEKLLEFRYCGDWAFLINLAFYTTIAYIATPLNYFRYAGDNFAKGTKSALNYFKERTLARYYWYECLASKMTENEKTELWKQLGQELQIQINEAIKGHISRKETINVLKLYRKTDAYLWKQQLKQAIKRYWTRKN